MHLLEAAEGLSNVALQKMYKKYSTQLKTKWYAVGRTNGKKTSHLSKTNFRKKWNHFSLWQLWKSYDTPENFYKINTDQNSDNLFIYMNISSISYHTHDLTALTNNFKIKPKVIGLSETRLS